MTDYHDLLETIYGNVHKLFGLIKDHEQDLTIIDKANSLLVDTKTDLLYLNDCIHRYVSNTQNTDQNADCLFSEITRSPNASASPPDLGVKNKQQQGSTKQSFVPDDSDDDEIL
jgi:CBS domain containing-hemolysin-like protein